MNPRPWLAPIIFLAGYSPLAAILLLKDFEISPLGFQHPILATFLILMTVISVFLTLISLRSIPGVTPIEVISTRDRSGYLLEYSLPYVVSFLDVNLGEIKSLIQLGMFLGVLFIVALRTQSLYMSPILLLANFRFMEVTFREYGDIERTQNILVNGTLKIGDRRKVCGFATDILFAPQNERKPEKRRDGCGHAQEAKSDEIPQRTDYSVGHPSYT